MAKDKPQSRSKTPVKKGAAIGVVLLLLVYAAVKGPLERAIGVKLPNIPVQDWVGDGRPAPPVADAVDKPRVDREPRAEQPGTQAERETKEGQGTTGGQGKNGGAGKQVVKGAKQESGTNGNSGAQAAKLEPAAKHEAAKQDPANLQDIGRGVLRSKAGLLYKPGSAEGHRTKHLARHTEDQPDRPGSHGVFEGGEEAMYAVLDEAYQMIKDKSPQVKVREQEGRQAVYEVDLGRRIGFVGGETGARRNHPAARRVRMVIEDGDEIITAFPINP